jgi:hypothetical protein
MTKNLNFSQGEKFTTDITGEELDRSDLSIVKISLTNYFQLCSFPLNMSFPPEISIPQIDSNSVNLHNKKKLNLRC